MSKNELIINGWIARDEDGELDLFTDKPERALAFNGKGVWKSYGEYSPIDRSLFPSVTWASEPLDVTITVKPTINNHKK